MSNTIVCVDFVIKEEIFSFSTKVIVGSVHLHACSLASFAMTSILLTLFSFGCLMTDLSAGKKIISSIPISLSFCTMSSDFFRLLGIATKRLRYPDVFGASAVVIISPSNSVFHKCVMRIVYLF